MSELDLLVRGGLAALPDRMEHLDIGVFDGRIVALEHNLEYRAAAILEASGLILLPGAIDPAVRVGDFASGSAALAAGGVTCLAELPGAAGFGPVFDRDDFIRKREMGLALSRLDFALWGGISARNLYELASLRDCGVIGFQASLTPFGPDRPQGDLLAVTPTVLGQAMKRAARLKLPVGIEVYDPDPDIELERLQVVLNLAGEAGCRLHLWGITVPEGISLVEDARGREVDATVATTPDDLLLQTRRPGNGFGLGSAWRAGRIDLIASGGRPGALAAAEHGFPEIWTEAALNPEATLSLAKTVARFTARTAHRFGLDRRKGELAVGRDADFSLLDVDEPRTLVGAGNPYAGREVWGRVVRTMQRGRTVFANGGIVKVAKPEEACFIRP